MKQHYNSIWTSVTSLTSWTFLVIFCLGFGLSVGAQPLGTNPDKFLGNITTYGQVNGGGIEYSTLWNQLTPENETKWESIEGAGRGKFNWAGSDAAYNYCKRNGLAFKFHCLIWGSQYPKWMDNLSEKEQYAAIEEWMDAVQKRYPDLKMIDVVNEAVAGHAPAPYKNALGGDGETGFDWIIKAFEMAHERWPEAVLIYNDYNTFQWNTDQFIDLVKTLRDAGAPIDAYGCQSHDLTGCSLSTLKASMVKIQNGLKMPMYISEYDIGTEDDAYQKKHYQEQLPYMWELSYCAGVTLWGYIYGATWTTDGNSGIIRNGQDRPAMTWLRQYMATEKAKTAKGPFPGGVKEASVYIRPAAIRITSGEKTTITVDATLHSHTIQKVELYNGANQLGQWTERPYTAEYSSTLLGYKNLRAVVTDTEGNTYERWGGLTVVKPRVPYNNSVIELPGVLEAENFDSGGEGVTTHDTDTKNEGNTSYRSDHGGVDIGQGNGGYVLGYTAAGEWTEYTVNVKQRGRYTLNAHVSSGADNSGFSVSVKRDGRWYDLAKIAVPNTTSWDTYTVMTTDLAQPLEEGEQIIRITIDGSYCNIDRLEFALEQEEDVEFDPNMQIYLCFGQSNMEGNAAIEAADRENVSERFQTLTACTGVYSGEMRKAGHWYKAVPPLCRAYTGLTPADYFGRVLIDSLSEDTKVGIVMVALGGASIDVFDTTKVEKVYNEAEGWFRGYMDEYGRNPYARLIELARQAQRRGYIRGILLHQGETDNGQTSWTRRVKTIHSRMMRDLGLSPDTVPLLVGEMRYQNQNGACYGHNTLIRRLPNIIKNCHVISADGCEGNTVDHFHFSTEGARELGRRYGLKMVELLRQQETTGIDKIINNEEVIMNKDGSPFSLHSSPVYNLQGQRVAEGYKGIIIHDGKKIIIK